MERQRPQGKTWRMTARRTFCAFILAAALAAPRGARASEANTKKKGGGLTYLQFQTLTATVVSLSGRRGVMTIEAGLDIPEAALRARAALAEPRLRAAYVQRVQIYASGLGPGAPPDPDYLARMLQQDTDRVLGQPGARFLLGAILVN
jgi:hypothetical protein